MKPIVKRIRAGKYTINQNGYQFDLIDNNEGRWVLFNHSGIEIYRDTTKRAVVNMLGSYNADGCKGLHTKQECNYA